MRVLTSLSAADMVAIDRLLHSEDHSPKLLTLTSRSAFLQLSVGANFFLLTNFVNRIGCGAGVYYRHDNDMPYGAAVL
jgi:hypothetical protein